MGSAGVTPPSRRYGISEGLQVPFAQFKYQPTIESYMTTVQISTPVNPSEDPEKVRAAILAIFPDAVLEQTDSGFEGTAPDLDGFGRLIRRQRILDATRAVLLKNMHGRRTHMSLNKQVATVGKVSFADRRPVLGAIEVSVEDDDLEQLIDRVAPMTVDGEEVKT